MDRQLMDGGYMRLFIPCASARGTTEQDRPHNPVFADGDATLPLSNPALRNFVGLIDRCIICPPSAFIRQSGVI
jgi:hypothetical protein